MKYMLIMNSPRDGYTQYKEWPKKILEANIASKEFLAGKKLPADESDPALLIGSRYQHDRQA